MILIGLFPTFENSSVDGGYGSAYTFHLVHVRVFSNKMFSKTFTVRSYELQIMAINNEIK